jgi:hypothetical protein
MQYCGYYVPYSTSIIEWYGTVGCIACKSSKELCRSTPAYVYKHLRRYMLAAEVCISRALTSVRPGFIADAWHAAAECVSGLENVYTCFGFRRKDAVGILM